MKSWKIGGTLALLLLVGYCSFNMIGTHQVIAHDEDAAAKTATQFAQAAFVSKDYSQAYNLLGASFQQNETQDSLAQLIAGMHKTSYPTQINATEYEPMPGQRAMNIFLQGTNGQENFYYRFIMEGDAPSGYKVAGIFRGTGPYPPSASPSIRQPLTKRN